MRSNRTKTRFATLVLATCAVGFPAGFSSAGGPAADPTEATEYHPPDPPETMGCLFPEGTATAEPPAPGLRAPAGSIYRIVNRFHIIRRSDGTGGLPPHLIDYLMRDLNVGFRDTPMRWVRQPEIVYIDNDSFYADLPNLNVIFAMYADYLVTGVVNWFFTPSIFQGQFVGYTSTGGSQSAGVRGQILINQAVGRPTNIVTPPHEMGHILSLWHPFETRFGIECNSGSNCSFTGDLLCDTPPSPCLHTGNITGTGIFHGSNPVPCAGDPPWNPDGRLYMDCGWPAGHILRDRFSPGQLLRMEDFLNRTQFDLVLQAPDVFVDCDSNGLDDIDEILAGTAVDLGHDMVPDVCQVFPEPGDLLVSGMNSGQFNRPRFFDGQTGAYRGDMWNGLTWVHQLRFGPDGYVYLARLGLVTRMDVRTARNVDVLIDGFFEGAGTFVDLLFDEQGDLLVLDNVWSNIRRYSKTGQYLGELVPLASVGMTSPKYMEWGPDGNLYVVGNGLQGNTIQMFDGQSGAPLGSLITPGSGGLSGGQGITFRDGLVYVSNGPGRSVLRYDATTGAFRGTFVGSGSGGLSNPHSLRFGPDGHLYVASRDTHSVKRYNGQNGSYMGDFVTSRSGGPEGTGGLEQPAGLLFCEGADAVTDLSMDRHGDDPASGDARLEWSRPSSGAPLLAYDALRASSPNGFADAECLATADPSEITVDLGAPAEGDVRYFLVRSGNVCGRTPVAPGSTGPRVLADCS